MDRTSSVSRLDRRPPVEQRSFRSTASTRRESVRIRGRRENCRVLRRLGFFLGFIFFSRATLRPTTVAADAAADGSQLRLCLSHGFHELLSLAGLRVLCAGAGLAWPGEGPCPCPLGLRGS